MTSFQLLSSFISLEFCFFYHRNCNWSPFCTLTISCAWSTEEPKCTWPSGLWSYFYNYTLPDCIWRGQNYQQGQPGFSDPCHFVPILHLYWNLCSASAQWSMYVLSLNFPFPFNTYKSPVLLTSSLLTKSMKFEHWKNSLPSHIYFCSFSRLFVTKVMSMCSKYCFFNMVFSKHDNKILKCNWRHNTCVPPSGICYWFLYLLLVHWCALIVVVLIKLWQLELRVWNLAHWKRIGDLPTNSQIMQAYQQLQECIGILSMLTFRLDKSYVNEYLHVDVLGWY